MSEYLDTIDIARQMSSQETIDQLKAQITEVASAPLDQLASPPPSADASQSDSQSASPATVTPAKSSWLKRLLFVSAAFGALSAGSYYGQHYWSVGRFIVSTDDAYVQADNTTIAPKVSGYLSAVLVGDNETVRAGQVLARIDDRDYVVALEQAKAAVAASEAAIIAKQAGIETQTSVVESARATIAGDEANEVFAEQENKRYTQLATTGYGSMQNAQNAASRIGTARAAVLRDKAALATAQKQVDLLKAELTQSKAALAHSQAVRDQAVLNLSYTNIVAPVDGMVGNRTLRIGQYVQAGTQLMSVVPTGSAYIIANYKETQLTDVEAGQPVEISVDMFPGRVFHGHVDSLAPASGQTFALLPPDNATGNFTKVVQRIPVKIIIDAQSAGSNDLRPGMSVTPDIDTKKNAAKTDLAQAN